MAKEKKKNRINKVSMSKTQLKKDKRENRSLKEKISRSKEYLNKSCDNKKKDNDKISFNFSIKMDKDGLRGDGCFIPPRNMDEEDKEHMARLIQKSIQDVNMFMTRAQDEARREHIMSRHPLHGSNLFDIFNDRGFLKDIEDHKYNRRF